MVSFNTEATTNVFPYAGALVTLALDADETCKLTLTNTAFILGVCEESGILQAQINVIIRGVLTVTVDSAVAAGDYLSFSTSVLGDAGLHGGATGSTTATRLIAIQATTGAGPVLALLF
jgi:hypothetical protein